MAGTNYDEQIDKHLQDAVDAENAKNFPLAETCWKRAVFYDARRQGIDVKQHVADCCPVY